jgi:hypothetical protein
MHRIGQKTTLQERVMIGKQAAAGRTDAQIAAKLDCSVWTVRKWRRIFVHQGRAGAEEPDGATSDWRARHGLIRLADGDSPSARNASWLGTGYHSDRTAR